MVALEWKCVVVDQQCRESGGKAKIEGYMSVSDEEAHHRCSADYIEVFLSVLSLSLYVHIFSKLSLVIMRHGYTRQVWVFPIYKFVDPDPDPCKTCGFTHTCVNH